MSTTGDDRIDTLLIDVRASTQGFEQDIAAMRGAVEGPLADGFVRAGGALERGLVSAIRRGSLGFDDLKRVAIGVLDDIAAQAARGLLAGIGGGAGGALAGLLGTGGLGGIVGSVLGLPGRATGGDVSPGRGYLVGERGPELFVPTTSGRIDPGGKAGSGGRDVKVAINIVAPQGASTPRSLQRSSRQVASAVRRALVFG